MRSFSDSDLLPVIHEVEPIVRDALQASADVLPGLLPQVFLPASDVNDGVRHLAEADPAIARVRLPIQIAHWAVLTPPFAGANLRHSSSDQRPHHVDAVKEGTAKVQ